MAMAGLLAAASVVVGPVSQVVPVATTDAVVGASSTFADGHFADFTVWSGLTNPTTVRFASDGRAFVAEKRGVIKEFDSITDSSATTVVDFQNDVMDFWDRGLLSIAIDPDFLNGRPFLYAFYVTSQNAAANAGVNGVPTDWGDDCNDPPGADEPDGCTVSARLDKITINPTTNLATDRENLLSDWCMQFPSHAGGALAFDTSGQLYVTGGDGASFDFMDYGQLGGTEPTTANPVTPKNPCNDPLGASQPLNAEGGMLRSQDIRTTGDPVGLAGSLIRIDPDTGNASSGNPLAALSSANAKRIVGHGFRNPFRMTFRPGTNDLYIGDVGNSTWEEINRYALPSGARTTTTLPNFGWPCYEGTPQQGAFINLHTQMCTDLVNQAGAVTAPLFAYNHGSAVAAGKCPQGSGGSSITGLAFYEGATGTTVDYPAKYDGALFFVDYSRKCIGALLPGAGGVPDPSTAEIIATGVGQDVNVSTAGPVDIAAGPGGDLYYVDMGHGKVMRIRYLDSPTARATADPAHSNGSIPIELDGSTSIEPNAGFSIASWQWDLDHNGTYDASGETYDWTPPGPGQYTVTLKVTSTSGFSDTTDLAVDANNAPPVPVIDTPAACGQNPGCWVVGDKINFSGHATDEEDGVIPASSLHWDVILLHCPSGCHAHQIKSIDGSATGSVTGPDHEYPSRLQLKLTATDSQGVSASTTVELWPETSTVHVASVPTGASITVNQAAAAAPWTATVMKGDQSQVVAAISRTIGGARYRFSTWNDTTARVRTVNATTDQSVTATYVPDVPEACVNAAPSVKDIWRSERSSGNGDIDWFAFTISKGQKVTVRVADQPISLRTELYKGCGTRIASANAPGRGDDVITRTLGPGTYRVKVFAPSNGWSASPYKIRFLRR